MSQLVSTTDDLATLLKVIADESRLRILGLLAEREHTGKELSTSLGLTAPTVSHHMHKLVDAGIVQSRRDAQKQVYTLNSALLLAARKVPSGDTEAHSGKKPGDERERTIRNFFEGDRLKTIPSQRKQRVIVLQHLMQRFEPDRAYREAEINDILKTAHEDFATLRRELVDYGYMERERGVYKISRSLPDRSVQVAQEVSGDEAAWLEGILRKSIEVAAHNVEREEA
jgi:biotin operon repressor